MLLCVTQDSLSNQHQQQTRRVLAHLPKSNSRTFQGTYKGYIRRTKLNQTGTFISICKCHKLPQRGLGRSAAENGFYAHLRSERSHLEHLFRYQLVRSRRFRKSNSSTFKDLQTQIQGLSRTMSVFKDFQALKIWKKNSRTFKDPQEPCLHFIPSYETIPIRSSSILYNHRSLEFFRTTSLPSITFYQVHTLLKTDLKNSMNLQRYQLPEIS